MYLLVSFQECIGSEYLSQGVRRWVPPNLERSPSNPLIGAVAPKTERGMPWLHFPEAKQPKPLKIGHPKKETVVFQPSIFRSYVLIVSFREGMFLKFCTTLPMSLLISGSSMLGFYKDKILGVGK